MLFLFFSLFYKNPTCKNYVIFSAVFFCLSTALSAETEGTKGEKRPVRGWLGRRSKERKKTAARTSESFVRGKQERRGAKNEKGELEQERRGKRRVFSFLIRGDDSVSQVKLAYTLDGLFVGRLVFELTPTPTPTPTLTDGTKPVSVQCGTAGGKAVALLPRSGKGFVVDGIGFGISLFFTELQERNKKRSLLFF